MPTRKLAPINYDVCYDSDHNPPSMMVFSPGIWEHKCPTCGKITIFTVPDITCDGYTPYEGNTTITSWYNVGKNHDGRTSF